MSESDVGFLGVGVGVYTPVLLDEAVSGIKPVVF